MIILDFGSGNTCKNNPFIIRDMINALADIDTGKHEIIIKWQLFSEPNKNEKLFHSSFDFAFDHAKKKGYQTTASVFDLESLQFLVQYDVPFIKIACRPELYWLAGEVPRKIPVIMSYKAPLAISLLKVINEAMCCIPKYPATIKEYEKTFGNMMLGQAISDHTLGLELYKKYQPRVWEKHFVLKHDKDNPDAGLFACTPEELKEIL